MKSRKVVHLLPILTILLIFLVLSIASYLLLFFRNPDDRGFNEAMLSVEIAVSEDRSFQAKLGLLQAARYAATVMQWKQLLGTAARQLPDDAQHKDYRLFAILASRARRNIPGNPDLTAFLVWAQLRAGMLKRANKTASSLSVSTWPTLQAELKIQSYLDDKDQNMEDFYQKVLSELNAEFLEEVAQITQSAVLTADAAFAYMGIGGSRQSPGTCQRINVR